MSAEAKREQRLTGCGLAWTSQDGTPIRFTLPLLVGTLLLTLHHFSLQVPAFDLVTSKSLGVSL